MERIFKPRIVARAINHLAGLAIQLYSDRRDEIDFEEYEYHFKELGSILARIDKFESLSEIISELEKNNLSELGYHTDDEDMLEEFLECIMPK